MVAQPKLYTEVELDQIRADAAEEARKAAAGRCLGIIILSEDATDALRGIQKEFSL